MSIYILCRIHCDPSNFDCLTGALSKAMAALEIKIELGAFEDEEKSELLADGYSWPTGIEFQLSDPCECVDSSRLWNESMVESRRILMKLKLVDPNDVTSDVMASLSLPDEYFCSASQTKLGRAIALIVNELGSSGGMIALIDGGIEKIEFYAVNQCFRKIVRLFLLPWNRLPNTAYVWPVSEEPRRPIYRHLDRVEALR